MIKKNLCTVCIKEKEKLIDTATHGKVCNDCYNLITHPLDDFEELFKAADAGDVKRVTDELYKEITKV